MITILKLRAATHVADDEGTLGTVIGFTRDHVLVRWDGSEETMRLTDDDLRTLGVVLVAGQ